MLQHNEIFSLQGIHALVTGGAGQIGRAVSRTLASFGASVTILYHGSEETAQDLVEEITSKGMKACAVKFDVQDEYSVRKAVSVAASVFGSPGILVNNSGGFSLSDQESLTSENWDNVINLNLRGAFYCSKHCLAYMKEERSGAIVNIASINGIHPGFGRTAHYDASKAGLIGYTKSLAAEVGPFGIRVNAVAPGLVSSSRLLQEAPDLAEGVRIRTPLKRLTDPGDAASAVLYLASPASRAVTGVVLVVDGGYLLT